MTIDPLEAARRRRAIHSDATPIGDAVSSADREISEKSEKTPTDTDLSRLSRRGGEIVMSYLDLISGLDTPDSEPATDATKSRTSCSECGRRLYLPESQAIGRCIRAGCQSEAEFVDTLARIKIHHERTQRAVAARVKELGGR
jgi:hypothetical protein